MKAERTIAIIGDTGKFCPALVKSLAGQNVRLLFVSGEEEKNRQIEEHFIQVGSTHEIEFISCEKEGCWEADIIAFSHPEEIEPQLVQKIKDVATQKVVLVISEFEKNEPVSKIFEDLLPHSRVVNLALDSKESQVEISARDNEARKTIEEFFKIAGYSIKIKK